MPAGTRTNAVEDGSHSASERPAIAVCRSSPETTVFLESGNTEGWIASDATVDVDDTR